MAEELPLPGRSQQRDFLQHLDQLHAAALRGYRGSTRGQSSSRALMDLEGIERVHQKVKRWKVREV